MQRIRGIPQIELLFHIIKGNRISLQPLTQMHLKKLLYTILFCVFTIYISNILPGCANIVAPTGGPRDTLGPVLVTVNPKDSTLNFDDRRITFTFNEYVQLTELTQNLIVSPTPVITPQIDAKLKTITVRIKDTLEPNTTYSIQFGNAVRDINEGNVLRDFTYLFSTGPTLDTGTYSGRVRLAQTGTVDSTLIVMLHRRGDDSAVIKQIPRYFTRLDSTGTFRFRNLPEETFYLYALKDESGTRRYLGKSQLFAFADSPIVIGRQNPPVTLYAYVEEEEVRRPSGSTGRNAAPGGRAPEDKRLRYETNLEGNQQDLMSPFHMTFPVRLKTFDSTKFIFTDTSFRRLPGSRIELDTSGRIITLRYNWTPNTPYRIIIDKDFAEDSLGRKLLKTDTLEFAAKKESDYGSLRIRVPSLDLSRHPVLQLVQAGKVVQSHVFTTKEFYSRLFKPGDYEIRILFDEIQNGVWDPGEFFGKRRQPEKVISIKSPLKVRANWDNNENISALEEL
jgi:hypothetical protein